MWTEITRRDYERRGGRYASDMTDREWALFQRAVIKTHIDALRRLSGRSALRRRLLGYQYHKRRVTPPKASETIYMSLYHCTLV